MCTQFSLITVLGHFGPDISVTDISVTENAESGRFGHNHKCWVGVCLI